MKILQRGRIREREDGTFSCRIVFAASEIGQVMALSQAPQTQVVQGPNLGELFTSGLQEAVAERARQEVAQTVQPQGIAAREVNCSSGADETSKACATLCADTGFQRFVESYRTLPAQADSFEHAWQWLQDNEARLPEVAAEFEAWCLDRGVLGDVAALEALIGGG